MGVIDVFRVISDIVSGNNVPDGIVYRFNYEKLTVWLILIIIALIIVIAIMIKKIANYKKQNNSNIKSEESNREEEP